MNNNGGSKVLSVYWFIILVIIAGGIFGMVYSFYHHPYDVRELEAHTMANQIADCLSYQGKLNSKLVNATGFSSSFSENFMKECSLNFETEDFESWAKEGQYYLEINFYNATNQEESVFTVVKGNQEIAASCAIQEEEEYKREAKCLENEFFAISPKQNNKLYLIKVLSAVKKVEKNIK